MSLKAKLEAVIYAAEEPVTLAQLASLFAAEALEYKAALAEEAAAAEETTELLPLTAEGEEEPPVAEGVEAAEAAPAEETPAEQTEPVQTEQPAEAADPAADAKQAARLRDREVKAVLRKILDELIASYEADERGVEIREIAGGYRMATKPSCHDAVRLFVKSLKPPLKLSLPALETLAVIAYKQPITAPEVSEIRGVESGGVLGSLMARKLIATAGRKQVIGRPMLYKTTKEFLLRFGLKDLSELPSMEEFEKIAAVEIEEMEPAGTAASDESASNLKETASEATRSDEPSQQAETEAASDATEESKQIPGEEDRDEQDNAEGADARTASPGEENGGEAEPEESRHEEGEPEAEEAHGSH